MHTHTLTNTHSHTHPTPSLTYRHTQTRCRVTVFITNFNCKSFSACSALYKFRQFPLDIQKRLWAAWVRLSDVCACLCVYGCVGVWVYGCTALYYPRLFIELAVSLYFMKAFLWRLVNIIFNFMRGACCVNGRDKALPPTRTPPPTASHGGTQGRTDILTDRLTFAFGQCVLCGP